MLSELKKYGLVFLDKTFKEKTSFKVGGKIKYFVEVFDIQSLCLLINYLYRHKIPYFVLGNGTNLLVSDEDFEIVVISLKNLNKLKIENNEIIIEAGAIGIKVAKKILEAGYKCPIPLSLIPGTIGGMIYMNAGAYGEEIKDTLIRIDYITKEGVLKSLNSFEDFTYRNSYFRNNQGIIIRGYFKTTKESNQEHIIKLQNQKKLTQPLNTKCAGSIFKNIDNIKAWQIIKELSLDKLKINDACISDKHANVIINKNNANFNDLFLLINKIKEEVYQKKGIILELEIKILKPSDFIPFPL
ncbi:MAG: UDP-N-acetylmuramate dehydrogenase [Bacilli bacterium]|nr:UDP-N-acetylmuramate dehydrogenase [Bacilli bacterium]